MRVAALTLLVGCTQVLDLDDRAPTVSGTILRSEIRNDADRSPVVIEAPFDPIDMLAVLDDGTRQPVRWLGDGRFWFPVTRWDQPYRLQVTTATGTVEYQHHARFLRLGGTALGRLERTMAPTGTSLEYMISDAPATGDAVVDTTGVWTETVPPSTAPNTSFSVDWAASTSLSGISGLLDAAQSDRAYWIFRENFSSPQGEVYWHITRYREDDLTLPPGAVTTVTGTSTPLDSSACLRVDLENQTEATRLEQAGVGTGATGTWRLTAVPAPEINTTGLGLASHAGATDSRDLAFDLRFGNPFPGHQPVILTRVTIRREVLAPSAVTLGQLACGTNRWMLPVVDDCVTPAATATSVAIPGPAKLDTIELATDRQMIPVDDSHNMVLTWGTAGDGPVDHYVVTLLEPWNARGTTTVYGRAAFVTLEPRLEFDPRLLHPGKLYVFSIMARTGFPRSAEGDLVEQVYPIEEAFVPTTSFFAIRPGPL